MLNLIDTIDISFQMNVSLGQIKFKVVNTSNLDNNIKQIYSL